MMEMAVSFLVGYVEDLIAYIYKDNGIKRDEHFYKVVCPNQVDEMSEEFVEA